MLSLLLIIQLVNILGSSFESTSGLRQNEYYYLDFKLDTMSVMTAFESDDQFFSSNSIKVGIFSDIPLQEDYIARRYFILYCGFKW